MNGKGPSISCVAKLRLQRSLHDPGESVAKPEDIQFRAPTNASLISVSEKILERSSLKCRRQCEQSPTRARSSSFLRRTASCAKEYVSVLPARKRVSKNASNDIQKLRFKNDLSAQKNTKTNLDRKVEVSEDHQLLDEKDITEVSARSPLENVKLLHNQTTDITVDKDNMEMLEKAAIIKEPADITVFRGNKAVLRVTYQGRPEPIVKWLRVVGSFFVLVINFTDQTCSKSGKQGLRFKDPYLNSIRSFVDLSRSNVRYTRWKIRTRGNLPVDP